MTFLIMNNLLDDPNSPFYDWRFWVWCGSCLTVAIIISYFIEKNKP